MMIAFRLGLTLKTDEGQKLSLDDYILQIADIKAYNIHNKMENELHIILNRWLTDITDAGSFDPHKYKDDYLAITEYICSCDRETTRNALRTLRDFSLKRDCSLIMLKELITEILNLI